MDITRTPTFSKAALPSGCGCDGIKHKTRFKARCALNLVFYMLVPYLDSVSNHNRQITASNASVSTHSPFLLVGDYAPPTRNTEFHSVPTRTANALKGDAKMTFPFKDCISMTFGAAVKQGSTWKMGWQNTTPSLMRLGQNLLSKRLEKFTRT